MLLSAEESRVRKSACFHCSPVKLHWLPWSCGLRHLTFAPSPQSPQSVTIGNAHPPAELCALRSLIRLQRQQFPGARACTDGGSISPEEQLSQLCARESQALLRMDLSLFPRDSNNKGFCRASSKS